MTRPDDDPEQLTPTPDPADPASPTELVPFDDAGSPSSTASLSSPPPIPSSTVPAATPRPGERLLTASEFQGLAEVPPELEWFANIANERTRKAYQNDVGAFTRFVGIERPQEFRKVTRAHVIAWRKTLEARGIAPSSIRRKLAALSSLFNYLCERNAVADNPVHGVERPRADANEGKTPAIGDAQARRLLAAPSAETLKGKRDRAILATFLYHGLRREELCGLKVRDQQERRGVMHFRVHGKGGKIRFVPIHPTASVLIHDYLEAPGTGTIQAARCSAP